MISFKSDFIDQVLDPLGVIIGLVIAIPVIWTWWDLVFGRRMRHRRWQRHAVSTTGRLPAVLVVDLLPGKDVSVAVRHFIAGQPTLQSIADERIVKIVRNCTLLPEHMADLALDIQNAVAQILRQGADELHVFLAGPGCASAMVGAELSNTSCRVFLYQTGQGSGTYTNFGPLRHPRF